MDLLQIIKLVSIPKWVKFFSLTIISIFIGLAIYAIFGGAHLADGAILQAGMGLLGVLLPLSIAIIFLSFYEAGVLPLKKATEKTLTQLIPDVLSRLGNANNQSGSRAHVTTMPVQEYTCFYRIGLPDKRVLRLEVQLNVRKVCAVFYFAEKQRGSSDNNFSDMEKRFEHTLAGARLEGYTTNNVIGHKEVDGVHYNCLVLYKALPQDFLWNSAEKLYFAQDLQVMVDSMIREAGDLLTPEGTSDK
jgi:hypothetical protein